MASSARSSFRSEREQKETSPEADGPRPLRGLHVLIVDDEYLIAAEIEAELGDAGADIVGPALTLESAVALAEFRELDAAVLDIQVGHDTIAPVASVLAARGIPFLFYTGQIDTDPIRAQWPAALVVSKPSSAHTLIAAVRRLVRR
jgi:DNA-binding NarL/FixJ family response regulator